MSFSQVDSEIAKIKIYSDSVVDAKSKSSKQKTHLKKKTDQSPSQKPPLKQNQSTKSTLSLGTVRKSSVAKKKAKAVMSGLNQKCPEQPPVSVDKLRQQYKRNQIQYNQLLEKFEKQSKKVLEMEDDLNQMKTNEFKNRYKLQLDILDKKYQESTLKVETLKQQIRDTNRELYQYRQQNHTQAVFITTLQDKQKTIVETMQNDSSMKELQNTIVTLCDQHLFQRSDKLSMHDKKLL